MKPRKWFLRIYLIIALLYGLLGLIDNGFIIFRYSLELYRQILIGIAFIFFFFNIGSIAVFRHHRVERIAYVLPIYHLITYLFFLAVGFGLTALETVPGWMITSLIGAGILTSLFEVVFSIYLLKRIFFTSEI